MSPIIKIQKHIEIVRTTNKGLGSMSSESAQAIYTLLKRHYSRVGISIVNNQADLKAVVAMTPDLIFNAAKYVPKSVGDDTRVWVAGYFESQGIVVTGSSKNAHMLELDKYLAKQQVLDCGLRTSRYIVFKFEDSILAGDISIAYPVFIKPTSKGGGAGIDEDSVAHNFADLSAKIQSIKDIYNCDVMIEEYLPGREFSVAILQDYSSPKYYSMPLELIAPINTRGNRILSSAVKSADTESFKVVTDIRLQATLCDLALKSFNALGARDYGRIDIRLDKTGMPQFLEANLIPSLIENYGNFPKACKLIMNLSFESLILQIVLLGFRRNDVNSDPVFGVANFVQPILSTV